MLICWFIQYISPWNPTHDAFFLHFWKKYTCGNTVQEHTEEKTKHALQIPVTANIHRAEVSLSILKWNSLTLYRLRDPPSCRWERPWSSKLSACSRYKMRFIVSEYQTSFEQCLGRNKKSRLSYQILPANWDLSGWLTPCGNILTIIEGIPDLKFWHDCHKVIQSVSMVDCTNSHEIWGLALMFWESMG